MEKLLATPNLNPYVHFRIEKIIKEIEKKTHQRLLGHRLRPLRHRQRSPGSGFDELTWVDSDVVFYPDDIERLRGDQLPLVCGIYSKKGQREYACDFLPGPSRSSSARTAACSKSASPASASF